LKIIQVNGIDIKIRPTNSRFKNTAFRISDDIYHSFKRIGITQEYIRLEIPRNPLARSMAEIGWTANGQDFYYSSQSQETYRDNLGVIGMVIQKDVYAIVNGLKEFGQVMNQYRLGYDPLGVKIRSPREVLGISKEIKDLEYIEYRYKSLAKEMHPDTGGDAEKFKELNEAYNILKEELNKK
jgi:hypothetical protein